MAAFARSHKIQCQAGCSGDCSAPTQQNFDPENDARQSSGLPFDVFSGGMHCVPSEYLRGKSGLSRVDIALLAYILDNPDLQGSRAEIADDCGCAPNSIPRSAKRLEAMGLITREVLAGQKTAYRPVASRTGNDETSPKPSRQRRRSLRKGEWRAIAAKSFGGGCYYCGATHQGLEIEHAVPLARGGSDSIENMVAACRPCNHAKGVLTAQDFLAQRPNAGARTGTARDPTGRSSC